MSTAQKDLEKMIPAKTEIEIRGETIHIPHVKVGMLPAVIQATSPFLPIFTKAPGGKAAVKKVNFLNLVMDHTTDVVDLVSVVLGREKDWVNDLDLDELITIVAAIVEVNLDFFIQRVLPSVSRVTAQLGGSVAATASLLHGP